MWKRFLVIILLVKYVESVMEGFIFGGKDAKIKWYPHQVYLEIFGFNEHVCGGSILNQVIIMTAAHCLEDFRGNQNHLIIVRYGSENLNTMQATVVNSYKIHEHYDFHTMYGDLALLRCKNPIELGIFTKRVAIMKTPPKAKLAYIAGWGDTNTNMDSTDYLKHTQQKLLDVRRCWKLKLPRGALCADSLNGREKVAKGDSGGALIIENYIQIGIVSYTVDGNSHVAYTDVSYHYAWINRNAAKLYCHKYRKSKIK